MSAHTNNGMTILMMFLSIGVLLVVEGDEICGNVAAAFGVYVVAARVPIANV
jgi:hypothetical protein